MGVPAPKNPDHVHGDAFSATMLLKPTVRRLNAANAFATGHDKGAIAPPLNPLACHVEQRELPRSLVQSLRFQPSFFQFMLFFAAINGTIESLYFKPLRTN